MKSKEYKEGERSWEVGLTRKDCPYPHPSKQWQAWFNGWCDKSEKAFAQIAKLNPQILIDN